MDAFFNMPWDGQFLIWLQENVRSDVLTPVMKLITHLGDKGIFWILIAIVMLFFKKTRPLGMMAGIALVFSVLINNVIIKPNVGRIRPYEVVDGLKLLIERQHDPSFPSGHSGASFAAAVVFLVKGPKKIGIPAIIMAALIAFSRLYVGVHYPTDVICGIITGTCCAIISFMIWSIVEKKASPKLAGLLAIEKKDPEK
ncbi:MAG: phosphatase PAP2 family protein [Lachnospiraceae bacterium]|nr:phosphatase PAP2 family protein [Lachnospiraceae bacterium]MBO7362003.1 phosphatase PAP2 family protein [Lachnospiraceae bacterium]MBP5253199.1 phosphatase PAP2 family protein [Lachnospiraceae bacterium]MBP5762598.1 phosphatase PAP2 family protein [Lachnospiraceae bacterium]